MESHQSGVPLIVPELPEKKRGGGLPQQVWEESKKLWEVVGPAMFMRLTLYSMNVISQAFAGHLGDRELAAFSIATTVISGLNFGFLVRRISISFFMLICSRVVRFELQTGNS
jgi:multidrug resistance protein, MATE family